MEKLINGIVDFRTRVRPSVRETFARLALGQSPDCLFIACSDSRVVPNLFASTDPGDLFVVRNVGNLVPPAASAGRDRSTAAAVEFAIEGLAVHDIIVCGHSSCGAMSAILTGSATLGGWLEHGSEALEDLEKRPGFAPELAPVDRLSQLSVLRQVHHLRSHASVARSAVRLHAWWFDIAGAEVLAWDAAHERFVPLTGVDEPPGAGIVP